MNIHPTINSKLIALETKFPEWMVRAIKQSKIDLEIEDPTQPDHKVYATHWPSSNPTAKEHIVLIHGAGAHRKWFDFIAPLLANKYHCTAIDLPGMGDSSHRESYQMDDFVATIDGAVDYINQTYIKQNDHKFWLVGHSFGGSICMLYALRQEMRIKGIIIADTPIRPPTYDYTNHKTSGPIRKKKIYPDFDTIYARYKLIPEQIYVQPLIVEYIKLHSITHNAEGWQWKFDDNVMKNIRREEIPARMHYIETKSVHHKMFIYGEKSFFFQDRIILPYITKQTKKHNIPLVKMKNCHHHLILDNPVDFASLVTNFVSYHTN